MSCVGSGFLGGMSISPIYRRFIADLAGPQIGTISPIYADIRPYVTCFSHITSTVPRGSRGPCLILRSAIHNAVYNKLNEPDLMQHHGPLRDHRHGHAKGAGPWGAWGRLPVTKRWPWASSRPIPVQRRVMCCILAQGTMEWHQVGSWGPSFVSRNPST